MTSLLCGAALRRCALAAALAVLALVSLSASADGARRRAHTPSCRTATTITTTDADTGTLASVALVRAQRLSCRSARRVVMRCAAGRLSDRWESFFGARGTTWIVRGRRRVIVRPLGGERPACLAPRAVRGRLLGAAPSGVARPRGEFGPYERPNTFRGPNGAVHEWGSPVTTYRANIPAGAITTVDLTGFARNVDGEMRSTWFEYGETRDLGTVTERKAPRVDASGAPITLIEHLSHLRAGTRWWWRTAANVEDDAGRVTTRYGTMGSFVTGPYPRIANPHRPCMSGSWTDVQLFEVTESLALACTGQMNFRRGACFPACASFFHGRLQCSLDYPRNLNTGRWGFSIPYVAVNLSVDNLVSYWRSDGSNRFITAPVIPGVNPNLNSEGGDVGPTPGWHNWDVAQWGYPFTRTSTDAEFWINCTQQWGRVIDGKGMAKGQGDDTDSRTAPSAPLNPRGTATGDGGVDVTWDVPATVPRTQIAGYFLTFVGATRGTTPVFLPNFVPTLTVTEQRGRISAANIDATRRSLPAGTDTWIVVAALSRDGNLGELATVPWPPR